MDSVKTMGAEISLNNGAKRQKISVFQLDDFPDEIILNVLRNLDVKDLLRCARLCKRIYAICQDDSLYQKVNLCIYKVSSKFVKWVLEKGCQHLSIKTSKFEGELLLNKVSKVKSLDLFNCDADEESLQVLLKSCNSLQNVTLKHFTKEIKTPFSNEMGTTFYVFKSNQGVCAKLFFNGRLAQTICNQNGNTLKTLQVSGAHMKFIKSIVDNCVELTELNLVNSMLNKEEIFYLVDNLTPKIEKLNLHHVDKVNDDHIDVLVQRCNKLKVLDLRRTAVGKDSLNSIVKHLQLLEELYTNLNYTEISTNLHKLDFIPKLRSFSMKWNELTLTKEEQKCFKKQLPKLKKIQFVEEEEPLPKGLEGNQICLTFQTFEI